MLMRPKESNPGTLTVLAQRGVTCQFESLIRETGFQIPWVKKINEDTWIQTEHPPYSLQDKKVAKWGSLLLEERSIYQRS